MIELRKMLLACILTAGISLAAHAQSTTLAGRVVIGDDRGALPGVTVTLTSPRLERATTTDDWGRFAFLGVPPGDDYVIRFELPGLQNLISNLASFRVGERKRVEATMSLSFTCASEGHIEESFQPEPASFSFPPLKPPQHGVCL